MNQEQHDHYIASMGDLLELYGEPLPRSLLKELDHISGHYRQFVERAPFVIVATAGPEGLDCSPRGDPPGFARVVDENTILLPDRRGNNRLDTLKNIIRDSRISLLFLIPGVGETMRGNLPLWLKLSHSAGSVVSLARPLTRMVSPTPGIRNRSRSIHDSTSHRPERASAF